MRIKVASLSLTVYRSDLILLALWLLAFLIVWPTGNFPINDDWAYSKNVYNLVEKHQFVVDQFPAMNLISQTIYGSIYAWCFGFSFLVLRVSIFVLAILSSITFNRMLFRLTGGQEWFSFFLTALLFFNSLFLSLSFTFMTDIFFLSMLIFSIQQLYNYLEKGKIKHYFLFILFLLFAVLNRQHGLLISILSFVLLFGNANNKKRSLFLAIIPPLLAWLAHDKYRHYLAEYTIANGIRNTKDLINYLSKAELKNHFIHAADSLLVMGGILFPLTILMFVLFAKHFKWKKDMLYLLFISCIIAALTFLIWEYYPIGNISGILEVGPKVVKVDYLSPLFGEIRIVNLLLSFISIVLVVFFLLKNKLALSSVHKSLPYLILSIAIILFVFVSISEAYFDRYNIPMIMFVSLLLVPQEMPVIPNPIKVVFSVFIVCLFTLSVLEVRDYFRWQETRWEALRNLNSKGISANRIDGGFEYNGWNKPIDGWPDNGKSWWWVDDDEYVISTQVLKNYSVDSAYVYQKLIPYNVDTIYVLKRKSFNEEEI